MSSQHTPQSILQLARGFTQSRILITSVELDLFTLLHRQPLTAQAVAKACQAQTQGITILLDALVAMGFLEKQNDSYQTESGIAPYLSADSPETILPMVIYSADLWQRWSKLTDIILGKTMVEAEDIEASPILQTLVKAMHSVNVEKAPDVIGQIKPGSASYLLDVGGGAGTYTLAFLQALPEMQATLFDFPSIAAIAREHFEAAAVSDRVQMVAGNYLHDALPGGHDIALLSAIIHQHTEAENIALYTNVFRALSSGGRIVIRGFVMSDDHTEPPEGALFAVNMLTSTPGGRTYSFAEIQAGLEQAGFVNVRMLVKAPGLFSLIDAFKP